MLLRLLPLLMILLLAACSSTPKYQEPKDGGPAAPVDVSHVPNAQPKPVVRTRAGNNPSYTVLGKTYQVMSHSEGYKERGLASWYGTKFHGRNTANGEVYDMYAMTAAHKTVPIPSYLKVTSVANGRSVIVRVNDRGPFHGNRIIDLSYAAAKKLGIDKAGTGMVDLEDVTPSADSTQATVSPSAIATPVAIKAEPAVEPSVVTKAQNALYLQVGAFQQQASALQLKERLLAFLRQPVSIVEGDDQLHRVHIGPLSDQQLLADINLDLENRGLSAGIPISK